MLYWEQCGNFSFPSIRIKGKVVAIYPDCEVCCKYWTTYKLKFLAVKPVIPTIELDHDYLMGLSAEFERIRVNQAAWAKDESMKDNNSNILYRCRRLASIREQLRELALSCK